MSDRRNSNESNNAICCYYVTECGSPLGVADNNIIRDEQMSASTHTFSNQAEDGRLNGNKAWRPDRNGVAGEWIQVTLDKPMKVTAIATQGRNSNDGGGDDEWVTQYKVQYSNDGQDLMYIKNADETADMVNSLPCIFK